ncbi:radical SAM protein [bacterium]|nr:radical SAM protein [bacterium]
MSGRRHKVLLLNPPARGNVGRDGYTSGPAKGPFLFQPMDLQIQSGFLAAANFRLEFLDAVYEGLSPEQCLGRIRKIAPSSVLGLVGVAFKRQDAAFYKALKALNPDLRIFLSGDIARFEPERTLATFEDAEGVLLDFGSPGLAEHLHRRRHPALLRRNDPDREPYQPPKGEAYDYPLPWVGFMRKYGYQLPFFEDPVYYGISASFGCPYRCRYCNTHLAGFRRRSVDAFLQELRYAKALGFASLYIRDATFFSDREWTGRLFERWAGEGHRFEWLALTRPDLVDDDLAERAAGLGCRMLVMGAESDDEQALRAVDRGMNLTSLRRGFESARRHGIRTAAQFIVGLRTPEPQKDAAARVRSAKESITAFLDGLDPDDVSLAVFDRRPGVSVTGEILVAMDEQRRQWEALSRRLERRFYLRPRRLLREVRRWRSWPQVRLVLKTAFHVMVRPHGAGRWG